jgi:hypothetical protein
MSHVAVASAARVELTFAGTELGSCEHGIGIPVYVQATTEADHCRHIGANKIEGVGVRVTVVTSAVARVRRLKLLRQGREGATTLSGLTDGPRSDMPATVLLE